ncbi:MAG: hypothetical protein J5643_01700 [Lachnospiraceae bacterium]|nr:hypothetical protein [Lachnospiraceae bacterium]
MKPEAREINSMEERYLVIENVPEEESFEEEIMLYNAIPGLLKMETGWMSGAKYHRYRISGLKSLGRYLAGKKISGAQFETMILGVFAEIREAKEYLLREDGFWISPESIYMNEQTKEIYLCYYPEFHCPLIEQMRNLSTHLLSVLDPNDEKAVYSGYAFYVLCHGDSCSFQAISGILEERPALPEISAYLENDEEEELPTPRRKRRGGILVGGSLLFLAWIGALLFLVLR